MKRDIIFPTSDFVFSLRVGGLLARIVKSSATESKNEFQQGFYSRESFWDGDSAHPPRAGQPLA